MTDHPATAIADALLDALASVTDEIVALSLSKDWPVLDAVKKVAAARPVRVLVRRPFLATEFQSVVEVANDAGEATTWRNDTNRDFGLIILGVADGKLDAGLNDVDEVNRKAVVRYWREAVEAQLKEHQELAKPALGPLVEVIFNDLADGTLNPKQVDRYFDRLFETPTLENAHSGLWIIGYLPDANVFDTNETRRKLARNRDLMYIIDRSDDQSVERRLREIAKSGNQYSTAAAELLSYRDDGDNERLSKVTRADVEAIFTSSSPQPGRKTFDLIGLLNELSNDRDGLAAVLQHLYAQWDLSDPTTLLEATFSNGTETNSVRVSLRPVTSDNDDDIKLDTPWSGSETEQPVVSAMSDRPDPGGIGTAQQYYTAEAFRNELADLDDPTLLASVDDYLNARQGLCEFEPWLEHDAFTLMILNASARTAAELFCKRWAELAEAVVKIPVENPGRRAAIHIVQSLETVQGYVGDDLKWITVGCFHPFRLDPLRRVAEHVTSLTSDEAIAQLGDAALWCLDRSYPAYPSIYFDEHSFYRASHKEVIAYVREHASSTPNLRDVAGLDGVFKAIEKYSSWFDDGINVLVIDPPSGGGVAKALTAVRGRRDNPDDIQVYHLATSECSDSLDEFNGPLIHLPPAKSLSDVEYLPAANIVLRFVAETTAGSETATSSWAATKGSHLALMMFEEKEGGPFSTATPRIKLDPRASNTIVRGAQAMLAALKGGQPSLATIRPLMQTDDATALSRIGGHADWVIFAAPGPLGLISPEQINSTLKFVGRATSGIYGLYVYGADNLFPVRREFETFFRDKPVVQLPPNVVTEQLMTRAHDAGQAVLYAAARGVGSQVATLVAIRFATKEFENENRTFVLSLDDFGWTQAWLTKGQRADFLVVNFASDGSVHFRIVESKSRTGGNALNLSPNEDIYLNAIAQVESSMLSLRNITEAENPTLEEDLRYASLIEHLMAAILGRSTKLSQDERKKVFEMATALSCRNIKPTFDGMVVVTQTGVNSPAKQLKHGELQLVWAGGPDTAQVFGGQVPLSGSRVPESANDGDADMPSEEEPIEIPEQAKEEDLIPRPVTEEAPSVTLAAIDEPDYDLARRFIQAGRVHGIPLIGDEPVYIRTGPTLFTFGIEMQEGAAIKPLENRLPDIARDVGIGENSDQITVANDTRPRTVRISLPREVRIYPNLPSHDELQFAETSGYLPIFLGQTIEGADWASSVQSWPHLLVAGTTGSGKTTFMKTLLSQFNEYGGERLQVVVVDGKGDTDYIGVLSDEMFPAEFPEVQLTHTSAVDVLKWAEEQMEERRKILIDAAKNAPSAAGVKAPTLYEEALAQGGVPPIIPLILVIDEFAEIMLASKKSADEFEKLVQRITQVGRSRLIHLILATQRPDKETVRGAIKANLDARAVFRLPTQADSMTVLGQSGAEKLLKHGDMLFQHGSGLPIRLQGYKI